MRSSSADRDWVADTVRFIGGRRRGLAAGVALGLGQGLAQGPPQAPQVGLVQIGRPGVWSQARPVQGFVGVDVSHPGDDRLVQQQRLDPSRFPPEPRRERGLSHGQGLRSKPAHEFPAGQLLRREGRGDDAERVQHGEHGDDDAGIAVAGRQVLGEVPLEAGNLADAGQGCRNGVVANLGADFIEQPQRLISHRNTNFHCVLLRRLAKKADSKVLHS